MHEELRDAMRRVDPPEGFADRVFARVDRQQPEPGSPKRPRAAKAARGRLRVFAVAASLVIAIGAGLWYRAEERRREGEEAKRQVLLSLNIAGSKLRAVQSRINHEQER